MNNFNHIEEKLIPYEQYVKLQQEFTEKEQKIEERLWHDSTVSQFDNLLRLNYHKSTNEFAKIVLDYIAELTKAYVGVFYIHEIKTQITSAIAGYACMIEKFNQQAFEMGEGIVGQAAESQKMIFYEDLPAKNIEVKSSTLNIGAASILVLPLVFNEKTFGVIELIFLRNLAPKYLQLLEAVGRNIAAMLESITNNEFTKQLLQQSQEQTDSLRAQEEELRQNAEELQATQEGMQKILLEVQEKESYMNGLINVSKDVIFTLDLEYKLVYSNKALKEMMKDRGFVIEKGLDFMLLNPEEQRPKFKEYYDRVLAGQFFEVMEEFEHDQLKSYIAITYAPLYDKEQHIIGIAVFGKNITDIMTKNQEIEKLLYESQQQTEQLKAQEEELRQNMEELQATQEQMIRKQAELDEEREKNDRLKREEAERAAKVAEMQKKSTLSLTIKLKDKLSELQKVKEEMEKIKEEEAKRALRVSDMQKQAVNKIVRRLKIAEEELQKYKNATLTSN